MSWLWGLFATLAVGMIWQSARSSTVRARQRAGYLADCLPLFANPIQAVAETGFARVSGTFRGQIFDIQLVPDSLSFRKLPCLWLLVTLPEPLAQQGTFDVLLRANGLETFSRLSSLPDQIAAPAGFPDDCTIRTDAPGRMPEPEMIGQYLTGLDRARLKELVVAPTGLRLVWLVEEADRGRYLLFRDAEMGATPLSPELLQDLMDGLCEVWAEFQAMSAAKLVAE